MKLYASVIGLLNIKTMDVSAMKKSKCFPWGCIIHSGVCFLLDINNLPEVDFGKLPCLLPEDHISVFSLLI